ncbi:MAG TPA: secondary thiamine-phosphate synthase enzyme YjbQ [Anaerolineales bacterium]|nr:secondary thiamine-phosphate synthase enzyme YjbQ [Anaerolineales bacterium]
MVKTDEIRLTTRGNAEMHNLTPAVEQALDESGLRQGTVTVFTPSSTSAITTIEYESGALDDLRRLLETVAPSTADYRHNLAWGDGNGHAHLRAALLGPSLSVPVIERRLALGTWQQILFIDFDVRPRQRRIIVLLQGEPG